MINYSAREHPLASVLLTRLCEKRLQFLRRWIVLTETLIRTLFSGPSVFLDFRRTIAQFLVNPDEFPMSAKNMNQ
jgi:hypothetical protein